MLSFQLVLLSVCPAERKHVFRSPSAVSSRDWRPFEIILLSEERNIFTVKLLLLNGDQNFTAIPIILCRVEPEAWEDINYSFGTVNPSSNKKLLSSKTVKVSRTGSNVACDRRFVIGRERPGQQSEVAALIQQTLEQERRQRELLEQQYAHYDADDDEVTTRHDPRSGRS